MTAGNSSTTTPPKEALLGLLCGYVLSRLNTTARNRYCVFDLNAGQKDYPIEGRVIRGSTSIVRGRIDHYGSYAALWWVDKNRKACVELERALPREPPSLFGDPPRVIAQVIRKDNAKFSQAIPERIEELGQPPSTTRGIVVIDPNGLPEVKLLENIGFALKSAKDLDVFITVHSARHWWSFADRYPDGNDVLGSGKKSFRETGKKLLSYGQIFRLVPRKTWMLTNIYGNSGSGGRGQVTLFGTNAGYMPPVTKAHLQPMYPVKSQEGDRIYRSIERPRELLR